jgi:glyceraldehyde 3-phosphate dehydrogenase
MRIGINGFGRIGRNYLRCALERGHEVAAVNDLVDAPTLAHLLKYDSTYGPLDHEVGHDGSALLVDGRRITAYREKDPDGLDWHDADIVIEATGRLRDRDSAARHLKRGARKVIISAPAKNVDAVLVMGVNEHTYEPERHDVVSNASCTTNCVAPMAKVLHEAFGVERGYMTTIHAYTGDQMLLDGPHKDLHRARSAAVNMIPTSTGAARSVGVVIPELAGRFDGMALRVPVENGSIVDLACVLRLRVTAQEINEAFAVASTGGLHGILRYNTDPIVSRDIVGDPASCVFDGSLTQAAGDLVKVFGWYDNEWGYTNRLADLAEYMIATEKA